MVERILIVSKDFDIKDKNNYAKDLCFFLQSKGIESHVVCYGDDDSDYDIGEKIHVHQVRFMLGANNIYNWHMLMNNELKRRSRELMEENDFDIVHCIDWTAYPAVSGVSRMFDKPYIMTIQSAEKERGFGVNESGMISDMEWLSAYEARYVVALNRTTYDILINDYKIPESKLCYSDDSFKETIDIYQKTISESV